MNEETLEAGFFRYFFRFLLKNDFDVGITPFQAASVIGKVVRCVPRFTDLYAESTY